MVTESRNRNLEQLIWGQCYLVTWWAPEVKAGPVNNNRLSWGKEIFITYVTVSGNKTPTLTGSHTLSVCVPIMCSYFRYLSCSWCLQFFSTQMKCIHIFSSCTAWIRSHNRFTVVSVSCFNCFAHWSVLLSSFSLSFFLFSVFSWDSAWNRICLSAGGALHCCFWFMWPRLLL